jgi:AcrR family transcriptional regulator
MINKNDPRAKRTRHLIQEAFWKLMIAKGFDGITVRDIARSAAVNRSTFYAHYSDKYAVLDEITEIAFEQRIPESIRIADRFTNEVCEQIVSLTYDYILSFYKTCRFNNKSFGSQVDEKVRQILFALIRNILLRESVAEGEAEIIATMISSAIYSAAYYWFVNEKGHDIGALSNVVTTFILSSTER